MLSVLAAGFAVSPAAAAPPVGHVAKPLPPGPKCITTTIAKITTRLVSDDPVTGKETQVPGSGSDVVMRGKLPDPFLGSIQPQVVFYDEAEENKLIARERVGDKVQACIVSVPSSDDPDCNPRKDGRGRGVRVYDYRRHFAYEGLNSEHGCGGA
jgi:hypothetical protein